MKNELSLLDRLLSDTPPFWIKVKLLGLALVMAACNLPASVPAKVIYVLYGVGFAMAIGACFAIKDITILKSTEPVEQKVQDLITAIPEQIADLKNVALPVINIISNKPAPSLSDQVSADQQIVNKTNLPDYLNASAPIKS